MSNNQDLDLDLDLDLSEPTPVKTTPVQVQQPKPIQQPQPAKPKNKKKLRTILLSTLIPVAVIGGGVGTFFAVKSCKGKNADAGTVEIDPTVTEKYPEFAITSKNIVKDTDSNFVVKLPANTSLTSITIVFGNSTPITLTPDQKNENGYIDGTKVIVKAKAVIDNKITITNIELTGSATQDDYLKKYEEFYQTYINSTRDYETLSFNSTNAKLKGQTLTGGKATLKYDLEVPYYATATFTTSSGSISQTMSTDTKENMKSYLNTTFPEEKYIKTFNITNDSIIYLVTSTEEGKDGQYETVTFDKNGYITNFKNTFPTTSGLLYADTCLESIEYQKTSVKKATIKQGDMPTTDWSVTFDSAELIQPSKDVTFSFKGPGTTNPVKGHFEIKNGTILVGSTTYMDTYKEASTGITIGNLNWEKINNGDELTLNFVTDAEVKIQVDATSFPTGWNYTASEKADSYVNTSINGTLTKDGSATKSTILGYFVAKNSSSLEVGKTKSAEFSSGNSPSIQLDWSKITDNETLTVSFVELKTALISKYTTVPAKNWKFSGLPTSISEKDEKLDFSFGPDAEEPEQPTEDIKGHIEIINTSQSDTVVGSTSGITTFSYQSETPVSITNIDWDKINDGDTLKMKFVTDKEASVASGTTVSPWTIENLPSKTSSQETKLDFNFKPNTATANIKGHFEVVNASDITVGSSTSATYDYTVAAGTSVSITNLDWTKINDEENLKVNFVEEKEANITSGEMPSTEWSLSDLPSKINNTTTKLEFKFVPTGSATTVNGYLQVVNTRTSMAVGSSSTQTFSTETSISITNLNWKWIQDGDDLVINFVSV